MIRTRLAYVPLDEAGCGAAAGRLLSVAELRLAQLPGVRGLGRASSGGHGGEVLAIIGVGHGERARATWPHGGIRVTAADGTLGVLSDVVAVGDRRRCSAAAVRVAHGGEYLGTVHRRFEAIRRDKFDGPRVGAVRQEAAVGRGRRSVYGTTAVLRRIQAAMALVFDRVDVHHQVSGLAAGRG